MTKFEIVSKELVYSTYIASARWLDLLIAFGISGAAAGKARIGKSN